LSLTEGKVRLRRGRIRRAGDADPGSLIRRRRRDSALPYLIYLLLSKNVGLSLAD
jgi:hypothetical protein